MSKYRIVTGNFEGIYSLEVEKVWLFGKVKYWAYVCFFTCYHKEKEKLIKLAKEEIVRRTVPGKVIVEFEYESNR